jgi:hypothetical protein
MAGAGAATSTAATLQLPTPPIQSVDVTHSRVKSSLDLHLDQE